jgi:hypothetical protein
MQGDREFKALLEPILGLQNISLRTDEKTSKFLETKHFEWSRRESVLQGAPLLRNFSRYFPRKKEKVNIGIDRKLHGLSEYDIFCWKKPSNGDDMVKILTTAIFSGRIDEQTFLLLRCSVIRKSYV